MDTSREARLTRALLQTAAEFFQMEFGQEVPHMPLVGDAIRNRAFAMCPSATDVYVVSLEHIETQRMHDAVTMSPVEQAEA